MKKQMADPDAVRYMEQVTGTAPWTATDYIGVTITIIVIMTPVALIMWGLCEGLLRWLEKKEEKQS